MSGDLPMMMASSYASTGIDTAAWHQDSIAQKLAGRMLGGLKPAMAYQAQQETVTKEETPVSARIVKVFIVDPNENLPLSKRMLYSSEEKFTDLSDQELFFEIPMADLLAKHNAERAKTLDKAQGAKTGREIFLEPARIRDLKMTVTTVATF